MKKQDTIILGAGMTGLATGITSNAPVFEAQNQPGGICSSYYIRPNEKERLTAAPEDDEAYRFEIGGGHWIFGGDPVLTQFINSMAPAKSYNRRSSVYFREIDTYVPYPLQNHLGYLDKNIALKAILEMTDTPGSIPTTMEEWLLQSFGKTLHELFFAPFHRLYTANLYKVIAPQDPYKSPVNIKLALQGAFDKIPPAIGYNTTFLYPANGLDALARKMAAQCNIQYDKEVIEIDAKKKNVSFKDGTNIQFDRIISTLPLNRTMEMTGSHVESKTAPYSSVLVLNIGAKRGEQCPDDHWLYNPDPKSGFHRVGFYSNVDVSFLPSSSREANDSVSIYVERAFPGGEHPAQEEVEEYAAEVVSELQGWDFITTPEVVDPTWIDVAYTWSWPGSNWVNEATQKLQEQNIFPLGRYAAWSFQGIANSIRDGFMIGGSFKNYQDS